MWSPALFCVFIRNIKGFENTIIVKYADDTTAITSHFKANSIPLSINNIIGNIEAQYSLLDLNLNRQKTQIMCITRRGHSLTELCPSFQSELKILGVIFRNDLKWHSHFEVCAKIASTRLYPLRCLKNLLTKKHLLKVYTAYIRSIMEYAAPLFIGLDTTTQFQLDRIQRRALRIIYSTEDQIVENLLARRVKQSTNLYKLAHNNSNHSLHHLIPPLLPRTRRFNQPHSRTNTRLNSFIPRTTILINEKL